MSASCAHHAPQQAPEGDYRRVLWIVLGINASMCVVELIAGWQARSVSLQADALDFFGDSMTYIITLLVLGMGARWRSLAGMAKGLAMGLFGLWVLATTLSRYFDGETPAAEIMGSIGLLALAANLFSAFLLFRFRGGDSNKRSVWLCTRNDAIVNLAVIAAGAGVWITHSAWPDLLVGIGIAVLSLVAAVSIIRQATDELKGVHRHA